MARAITPKVLMMAALLVCSARALASRRITIQQLEEELTASQARSDVDLARQLSDVELTERLSTLNLSRLQLRSPGLKSRQTLLLLADLSAFLPPPPAELSATPTPDLPAQRAMLALAVDYVLKTTHQLPNFSATRVTTGRQSAPWSPGDTRLESFDSHPLHTVSTATVGIIYRDGGEVVQPARSRTVAPSQGLTTSGEFGPILNTALLDAARGNLTWARWQQDGQSLHAVFHYIVPADKSHYEVTYCCTWRQNGDRVYFQKFAGYQGEIELEPASGTILRLTLVADLKPNDPLVKAAMLVEYGPVSIGDRTYICPLRSVALSIGLEIRDLLQASQNSLGQLQTSLNDSAFEQYHVFHSEVRMLSNSH